jgi:DNA-binding GntR family transcriptional regulator
VLVEAVLGKDRRKARQLITQHVDDAWRRARSSLAASEAADTPSEPR